MEEFRSDNMFCVVDFVGGRKRTVVPDSWLSINDTLCLLPPNATDSDVDALARNFAEPGKGWQMLEVASLQTFGSYSEAKKQLNKSKSSPQSETSSSQRKRKKPSYLEDYSTHDFDDGRTPFTVFGMDFDEEAMSENEWIPPPEFSSSIQNVSPVKKMIHNDHRPRSHQFNKSRLISQKENIDVMCDCQSSCHGTFLRALHCIQKQLKRTNQMVQQLIGGQKQTHLQLKRVLQSKSVNQMNDPEEVGGFSQDSSNFVQCVLGNQNSSSVPKRTKSVMSFSEAEDTFITGDQFSTAEMLEMKFKKSLRNQIKSALKEFQTDDIDLVLKTLETLGVKNEDHLKYVKSSDLLEVLNEVQARILVESFQKRNGWSQYCNNLQVDHRLLTKPEIDATIPSVSPLEAFTHMPSTGNEGQIVSPYHHDTQVLIEKVVSCNESLNNSPSTAVDSEVGDKKSGPHKCYNFPLPEFSDALKPLLEGEVLLEKDHTFLSSKLKEEIISFLNRENLICSGSSIKVRWEYRNLGETLAARYPKMLWDLPSKRQKKFRKTDAPIYAVFIRRLSLRRKMKRLRFKSRI